MKKYVYTLTASPTRSGFYPDRVAPDELKKKLRDTKLSNGKMRMTFASKKDGDVVGRSQKVERRLDEEVLSAAREASGLFTGYDFKLEVTNITHGVVVRTSTWRNGTWTYDGEIRVVPSSERYDAKTVNAIAEYLSDAGYDAAARTVRAKF